MAKNTDGHIALMTARSAAARRTALIERLIASAPPLTDEQVDRLRGLLHGRASTSRSSVERAS